MTRITAHGTRIAAVQVIPFSIPFILTPVNSGGAYPRCDHVLVRLTTEDGAEGVGEAAPMPTWIQGTQESIAISLEHYLGPAVLGCNVFDFADLHRRMDAVLRGDRFAKCAIDMAAHDAAARVIGLPVASLLGGIYHDRIPVAKSIRIDDLDVTVERAEALVAGGFGMVKLKIGTDPDGDVDRVRQVRRAVGNAIRIRVDINGGYPSYDAALRACRGMQEQDVALIEQPLPKADIAGLARLRNALHTPIAVDESLESVEDAYLLAHRDAADVFNVKLQKAGGFYPALKIFGVATGAHKAVLIGAMKETSVGAAASTHLAACCADLRYESDMTTHTALVDDLVVEPLPVADGTVAVPTTPGLGVQIDEDKLGKYRTK